jgi:DNA-binding response OmpR family regulator
MPKKILVIDDEPDILTILESRLKANRYEVVTASDGEEGLKKLEKETPDLVILDILMPKTDGYTFVREFKTIVDLRSVPIIVLTAKEMMRDLFQMEGVADYIVKPFVAEELIEKVIQQIGPG